MKFPSLLPPGFPRPPFSREEDEEEEDDEEHTDGDFRRKLRSEGFDPELVEMGIKVANNHSRSREDALRIGENYIRGMAK